MMVNLDKDGLTKLEKARMMYCYIRMGSAGADEIVPKIKDIFKDLGIGLRELDFTRTESDAYISQELDHAAERAQMVRSFQHK